MSKSNTKELKKIAEYLSIDPIPAKVSKDWNETIKLHNILFERIHFDTNILPFIYDNNPAGLVTALYNTIIKEEEAEQKRIERRKADAEKARLLQEAKDEKERLRKEYKYDSPEKRKVEDWLKSALPYIMNNKFEIYDDLSIDCYEEVDLRSYLKEKKITELPYKFNCILYDFRVDNTPLSSVKNFPTILLRTPNYSRVSIYDSGIKHKDKFSKLFSNYDTKTYDEFLSKVDGGEEILKLRNEAKKYLIILYDSATKKYMVGAYDMVLQQAKFDMYYSSWKIDSDTLNYHSYEEDLGLYDLESEWTEEDFLNRNPQKAYEEKMAKELLKKKKEALSKLSEEDRKVLGIVEA